MVQMLNLGLKNKGYITLTASTITAYTAVDGESNFSKYNSLTQLL